MLTWTIEEPQRRVSSALLSSQPHERTTYYTTYEDQVQDEFTNIISHKFQLNSIESQINLNSISRSIEIEIVTKQMYHHQNETNELSSAFPSICLIAATPSAFGHLRVWISPFAFITQFLLPGTFATSPFPSENQRKGEACSKEVKARIASATTRELPQPVFHRQGERPGLERRRPPRSASVSSSGNEICLWPPEDQGNSVAFKYGGVEHTHTRALHVARRGNKTTALYEKGMPNVICYVIVSLLTDFTPKDFFHKSYH